MAELILEIITPSKPFFKGAIKSVTVPGTEGSFQVLVNHAPIISTLETGMVKIEFPDGSRKLYACGGGTIEVADNHILLLADSLEEAESIDLDRARKAAERAKQRLTDRADKNVDFARAELALKKALNRINTANKVSSI
jgi:F-type H+-transporting ATPase subunit epsilon